MPALCEVAWSESVSNPTNRLRSPAAAASSMVSSRRIESTVAAPWNTRPMPRMPREQLAREAAVAEQVIVEEVQVPSRQARDLGERIVDALRVERSPALEERVLVAERAVVRAAARHDDRVRHQVAMPLDQVAPDRRDASSVRSARLIAALRRAGGEVAQELREGVLAGAEEDRVGVRRGFVRQRGDMQAAERDVGALARGSGRRSGTPDRRW